MLQIKQITRYDFPRYPPCGQYVCPPSTTGGKVRDVVALLALAALLDACDERPLGGVPVPPKYVSEVDARQIINQVFIDRDITLDSSQIVSIPMGAHDTLTLNVDGFNDSLQVGYEYVYWDDQLQFTPPVCATLDSLNLASTPHILTVDAEPDKAGAEMHLQKVVEDFLDSLAEQGVI